VKVTPLGTFEFGAATATIGLTTLATLGFAAAGRGQPARVLAVLFLTLAVSDLVSVTVIGWREWLSPATIRWLHAVNVPLAYLAGPLLYRYVVTLVPTRSAYAVKAFSWHAVPFYIAVVVTLGNALWALEETPVGATVFKFLFHAWVVQGVAYMCMSGWHLREFRSALEQVSADEAALRLSWLRALVAAIASLWVLAGSERAILGWLGHEWPLLRVISASLMIIALYCLAWFGLRQRILLPAGLDASFALPEGAERSRYARSGLGEPELAQIANDLSRLMTEQRLYADNNLDLKLLSERSGWSPNYISQALNQQLGRNFFEFVNGFRVAAAEQRLADRHERRAIVDIAMDCGFGSKSTFNTVFKRMTGVTPSEFRRARVQIPSEPVRSDA
jgi:AraC-like DNA-binding protein